MPLGVGTQIGSYEIVGALGAGGMGEVYRARDRKLNRDVALKILPGEFASDPDRLARFRREAQVLASLNHPNIGHIYGLEEGSLMALVLELVEGPTLADRIGAGAIPLSEIVPIASQMVAALEAAHEQGIIHRDLKPANVKVREDGTVKVLDFGLAKAFLPDADQPTASTVNSPTITAHGTAIGMILGTAAYMAPEQAKGKVVDKRADTWAFGVVLFEMLMGRRLFDAETVPETLAHVMMREIDLAQLPPSPPPRLRELVARCLVKDPKRRLRDIGEARMLLENAAAPDVDNAFAPAPVAPRSLVRRLLPIVVASAVTAAIVGGLVTYFKPTPAPLVVTRFAVTLPADQRFEGFGRRALSFSPDGTQLVYQVSAVQLYVRSMADGTARAVPGTDRLSIRSPTFSPDNQSVVFWAVNDRTLKTLALGGGAPRTVCSVGDNPQSISWTDDGITFTQGNLILRVSPNSSKPETLVTLKEGEEAASAEVLPGGQHVLFTLAAGISPDRWEKARIVAQSLTSGERTTVIEGGTDGHFVPTGHILYTLSGALLAVRFDPRRLAVIGGPTAVVEGVRRQGPVAQFAFSASGSLAYLPGPVNSSAADVQIVLADRKGAVKPLKIPAGPYANPRVSPDGNRIAFESNDGKEALIYVYDLGGATTMQRLTFGGNNRHPAWSGDGKRVAYQSDREGDSGVWWQLADGSGSAERLTKPEAGEMHVPLSFTRDGEYLLVGTNRGSVAHSFALLSFANKQLTRFDRISSSTPTTATFSPNGNWIAYSTTDSVATTVYVEPFPATGAKYRLTPVSGDVPHHPRWSQDGTELFYNPRPAGFEVVSVITKPAFRFGSPVAVPKPVAVGLGPPNVPTPYDVAPGDKFVGLMTPGQADPGTIAPPILHVVINWFEDLKRRTK